MLNLEIFRKIKPVNARDDWLAGQDVGGNFTPTTIAKGKLYRAQILELLTETNTPLTVNCISESLNIGKKVVASIVQKNLRSGLFHQGDKIMGKTGRRSHGYTLSKEFKK